MNGMIAAMAVFVFAVVGCAGVAKPIGLRCRWITIAPPKARARNTVTPTAFPITNESRAPTGQLGPDAR
jgi:hypothetical protein